MASSSLTDITTSRKWPCTHEDRAREWKRRREVFRGGEYSPDDFTRLFLFQGVNSAGEVVVKTRRTSILPAFLVETAAAAMGSTVALNVAPTAFPRTPREDGTLPPPTPEEVRAMEYGQAAMRRAGVPDLWREWGLSLASEGDIVWEVCTDDDGAWTFAKHKPEHVRIYRDRYERRIVKAVIEFEYYKPEATQPTRYRRVITPQTIDTFEDDQRVGKSVPNVLKAVGVVWARFSPVPGSPISKCAFTDVEDVVARADSATAQFGAIGTRHADPTLVTEGFQLEDPDPALPGQGAASAATGKTLATPPGTKASFLTVDLAGISAITEASTATVEQTKAMLPEFLVTESGANSSGLAMSYRAAAYVAKFQPIQAGMLHALATLLGMCRAAEAGEAWSDKQDIYMLDAGPVLPVDIDAKLKAIIDAEAAGLALHEDSIAAAQGLGFGDPEADPSVYAAKVRAQQHQRDAQAADMIGKIGAPQDSAPTDPATDPNATPAPAAVDVAAQALNGAQYQGMLDGIDRIQKGPAGTKAAVTEATKLLLPFVDSARIDDMFSGVVEGSAIDTNAAISPAATQP